MKHPLTIESLPTSWGEVTTTGFYLESLGTQLRLHYASPQVGTRDAVLERAFAAVTSGSTDRSNDPSRWRPIGTGTRGHVDPRPLWQTYIERRLTDMWTRRYRPNYPKDETLTTAWRTALGVLWPSAPTPSVVPGDDESVEFVWHKGGWDLELQIAPDEACVWARNRTTGEMWSGELDSHREPFIDLLMGLSS